MTSNLISVDEGGRGEGLSTGVVVLSVGVVVLVGAVGVGLLLLLELADLMAP